MSNKKTMTILSVTILLFSSMVTDSCSKSGSTLAVSFSKQITPVLTADCAINSSCHLGANSANQETNFDSVTAYNTMFTKELVSTANPTSSLLYAEVVSGEMPKAPYPPLTASQQALILNWIKQGAKDN